MKKAQQVFLSFSLVLLLATLLIACGGGGSGGISAAPPATSATPPATSTTPPVAPASSPASPSSATPEAFFTARDNFPSSLSDETLKRGPFRFNLGASTISVSTPIWVAPYPFALVQSSERGEHYVEVGIQKGTINYIQNIGHAIKGVAPDWALVVGKHNFLSAATYDYSATVGVASTVNGYTRQTFTKKDGSEGGAIGGVNLKVLSYFKYSGDKSWLAGGFWFGSKTSDNTGIEFGAYIDGLETGRNYEGVPRSLDLTYDGSYFAYHVPSSGSTPQEYYGNAALTISKESSGADAFMNGSFSHAKNMNPNGTDPTNLSFTIKDVPLRANYGERVASENRRETFMESDAITANCGNTACQQGEGNIAATFYGIHPRLNAPPHLGGVFSIGDLQITEGSKTVTGNLLGVFGTDRTTKDF